MTLTQGAPSLLSCASLEVPVSRKSAHDNAERDGVRIFATCDPLPWFIAQVREDGEWQEVARGRDLEELRDTVTMFVEHSRRDDLVPLLNVSEVVYGVPTSEQVRDWADGFANQRRAAHTLGMKHRAFAYTLAMEPRPMGWAEWCAMSAIRAARHSDDAVALIDGVALGATRDELLAALVDVRRALNEGGG